MAQDFRNHLNDDLPTSHNDTNSLLWTGGNYDAVISIRLANISTSQVTVDVYIRNSSTDYYLIKNAPIPSGGSIELIDAGSKIVLKNGDVLYGIASAATSVDAVVSVVDTISA
tara:strand:- start:1274 stop:1612 length:339 start_codon:yes stop_codon:yes gene_type:complete